MKNNVILGSKPFLIIMMFMITPVFGKSLSFDRIVYSLPIIKGKPLTIYIIVTYDVALYVHQGSFFQVSGITSSEVSIIHSDDLDFKISMSSPTVIIHDPLILTPEVFR